MPTDTTDINKLPMPGGGVNTPASGTYGEKASLERLIGQLPTAPSGGGQSGPTPVSPMQSPAGGRPPMSPPAGVPSVMMSPTQRPDVPGSTPLAMPAPGVSAPQTGRQRRMAVLDALANNPDVSDQTREWASVLIETLISGSAG